MLVYKAEKIASYVCFDILAKWWVKPDYIAVSVFVVTAGGMLRVLDLLVKPTVFKRLLVCRCRFMKCLSVT